MLEELVVPSFPFVPRTVEPLELEALREAQVLAPVTRASPPKVALGVFQAGGERQPAVQSAEQVSLEVVAQTACALPPVSSRSRA